LPSYVFCKLISPWIHICEVVLIPYQRSQSFFLSRVNKHTLGLHTVMKLGIDLFFTFDIAWQLRDVSFCLFNFLCGGSFAINYFFSDVIFTINVPFCFLKCKHWEVHGFCKFIRCYSLVFCLRWLAIIV
jgi:hypothetical protein